MYEVLIAHLRECAKLDPSNNTYTEAANAIEKLSDRNVGKWIYPSDITGFGRCSECKALWDYSLMINKSFKICPRCGSYNRGDDNVL